MKDSSQQNIVGMPVVSNLQSKQNRNTLFIGGNGINGGASYMYNNNMAQARQNTKESAESSKSRNGGLIEGSSNNGMMNYNQQLNINEGSVYSQNQTMSDPGNISSPYKGYNKNRISAKLKNQDFSTGTGSRNNAQNRLNVMGAPENNTVDTIQKKNSFLQGHGTRGS